MKRNFAAHCKSIRLAHTEGGRSRVSSIAVMSSDGHLLMGKRRDNGLWTLPGGHADPGESPEDCARRELWEEAGLTGCTAIPLRQESFVGRAGFPVEVNAFRVDLGVGKDHVRTHVGNDPDREVWAWEWVWVGDGLPTEVSGALHSPRNVVLDAMGLHPVTA